MHMLILSCLLFLLISSTYCYQHFQNRIPNGNRVPIPRDCTGQTGNWAAVGHYNRQHVIKKNPFGEDFRRNNFQWTVALCQADSDRDGVTNGAELGDPNCSWMGGQFPMQAPTGHPGICEPVGSQKCLQAQQVFDCSCLQRQRPPPFRFNQLNNWGQGGGWNQWNQFNNQNQNQNQNIQNTCQIEMNRP